mmetsp:Transcript_24211/g.33134  ORF Transcript_24211/g.33134 Transcript_24211/m.33134 type:complete len:263 (-) Transcript_24211:465-1253(-)
MGTRGSDTSSTYLEDYIEGISGLPNEVRRHFELMRDLDKEGAIVCKEISDCERRLIVDLKRRQRENASSMNDPQIREELKAKRQRAQQMADEKVQIAVQTYDLADIQLNRLDAELLKFEEYLRTSGDFSATTASPGEQIAAKPEEEWILARVLEYDINSGYYTCADEDDPNKMYSLSESQVFILEGARLTRGEDVYAVYPDTTSFYPATVTSAPRRAASATTDNIFCTVQFEDDADESGVNPDRTIRLQYVIRPQSLALKDQ